VLGLKNKIFLCLKGGVGVGCVWGALGVWGGGGVNAQTTPLGTPLRYSKVKRFQKIVSLLLDWNWMYKQNGILMFSVFTSQYSHNNPNVNNPGKVNAPNN